MTDNLNNLFGSNFSSDDIIDKKRLEKNIDNIPDNNDTQEDESSVGGRILSGMMFLAIVIFSIIFTVLITSNLSFLITCGRSLTAIGKDGKKRTSTANNSNLPSSIPAAKIHLDKSGRAL